MVHGRARAPSRKTPAKTTRVALNEAGLRAATNRGTPRFIFFLKNGKFYKGRDQITVTQHPSDSHILFRSPLLTIVES
jgi:hypothetical protein